MQRKPFVPNKDGTVPGGGKQTPLREFLAKQAKKSNETMQSIRDELGQLRKEVVVDPIQNFRNDPGRVIRSVFLWSRNLIFFVLLFALVGVGVKVAIDKMMDPSESEKRRIEAELREAHGMVAYGRSIRPDDSQETIEAKKSAYAKAMLTIRADQIRRVGLNNDKSTFFSAFTLVMGLSGFFSFGKFGAKTRKQIMQEVRQKQIEEKGRARLFAEETAAKLAEALPLRGKGKKK